MRARARARFSVDWLGWGRGIGARSAEGDAEVDPGAAGVAIVPGGLELGDGEDAAATEQRGILEHDAVAVDGHDDHVMAVVPVVAKARARAVGPGLDGHEHRDPPTEGSPERLDVHVLPQLGDEAVRA